MTSACLKKEGTTCHSCVHIHSLQYETKWNIGSLSVKEGVGEEMSKKMVDVLPARGEEGRIL